MSDHVTETCGESNGSWLPIVEYSIRTGVSLSTIRRKIKSQLISFRLEKGRYLILHKGDARPRLSAPQEASIPMLDNSARLAGEAFELALQAKDDRIHTLEKMTRDLEAQLNEMRLLVQVLEEKFGVRY